MTLNAVKAVEDALQLWPRDTDAAVADAQGNGIDIGRTDFDDDVLVFAGIFDGIVKQVEDGGAKFVRIAHNKQIIGRRSAETQSFGRQMMAQPGQFEGVRDNSGKVDLLPIALVSQMASFAGLQHLLDGAEKSLGVFEHDAVEVAPLGFVEGASLQRFKV